MMQRLQRRLVTLIFIAIIVGLSLRLLSGDGSLVHIYVIEREIAELKVDLRERELLNEQLARVTQSLKHDNDMIETIARRDMQMKHKDEVFFEY